ncbi:mitochondrial matrix Mmp37-domain-containing protein [Pyronema domesticum]|uniref:Phosphatidate cytidylyltransferase, mitochondrial n=1 Tax=Pyronema omphalodes (strain CBS 100304) TaxID=1076935 RepID=U4L0D7_PYROM|nr:mitochondrial matrix Mmp37-domain-containing protein [Pyronema domesticum]CCX05469.1 Similar to Mitochondrial translocator assembly and maintenance protein 41 homolog; acc. no. O74339 [Pyronema omphalodes CBS 100304]
MSLYISRLPRILRRSRSRSSHPEYRSFTSYSSRYNIQPTPSNSESAAHLPLDFESHDDYTSLPPNFGRNQIMHVSDETKERLRQLLWQFEAPVRWAIAYGSGVFSQGTRNAGGKPPMIDLIFGVTYTQHWHSINLKQHRDHYSFLGSFGSRAVATTQEKLGAGVYFNPYVDIGGVMVKYGVVSIDTLCRDLTSWDTLYLAGRLHKPVKILRKDPKVLLANQMNLLSAVRVALLLLPEEFTELQLYTTICSLSYMGDPRMSLAAENPHKVSNIVTNQLSMLRQLYSPLIHQLPNVYFKNATQSTQWTDAPKDTWLVQDMDPIRRGNMVRRLPKSFRERLYFGFQREYGIPRGEFMKLVGRDEDQERMVKKEGGEWERRIAMDMGLKGQVGQVIRDTVKWPSTAQSVKGLLTAGPVKSWHYLGEKFGKYRESKKSGK